MFSKEVRIAAAALIVLLASGVVMHYVFVLDDAPEAIRWGFVNIFVSTFASVVLTFLVGILLFDYQRRVTATERARLLSSLLVTELSETVAVLDRSGSVEIRLPNDDPTAVRVVIVHLHPSVIEEVVRGGGYFGASYSERVLRLSRMMVEYNTKVSDFLGLLSQSSDVGSSVKNVVLRMAQDLEGLREAIVDDCRLLIQHPKTQEHLVGPASAKKPSGGSYP